MAFREIVDNCGDDSRSSNPVLRIIDRLATEDRAPFYDKWQDEEQHPSLLQEREHNSRSGEHPFPPKIHNDFVSLEEFSRFEEERLSKEFQRGFNFGLRGDEQQLLGGNGRQQWHMPCPPHLLGFSEAPPPFMAHHVDAIDRRGRDYRSISLQDAELNAMHSTANLEEFASECSSAALATRSDDHLFQQFEHVYRSSSDHQHSTRAPGIRQWTTEFEEAIHEPCHADGGDQSDVTSAPRFSGSSSSEKRDVCAQISGDAWVDQFEGNAESGKVADDADLKSIASKFSDVEDPRFAQSEFFRIMKSISEGETAVRDNQFVRIPADRQASFGGDEDSLLNEFGRYVEEAGNGEFEEYLAANPHLNHSNWSAEFEEEQRRYGFSDIDDNDQVTHAVDQFDVEYAFSQDNPFLSVKNAFERGLQLFEAGDLANSVLAFEAAAQQTPDDSLAWQMLGTVQADNDQDEFASRALSKAVQVDPNNRDALLMLAVSYTNEYQKQRTIASLQQWLASHPDYRAIDVSRPLTGDFDSNHHVITEAFLQAARLRPDNPDPDVQVALGLLYNLTFQYDLAIDCFKTVAAMHPMDCSIWNKLGATQANSNCNIEALDSYARALEIRPSYARALCNLGISFLALKEYGEAAKAFLTAISTNPKAEYRWDNLISVFTIMGRPDLSRKCASRDVTLFEDEFHF